MSPPRGRHCDDGAAPESNRPSDGLRRLTRFEDALGHRARAAPTRNLALRLVAVVVDRVIDGDTIVLRNGAHVRLLQIDTPERLECYSDRATWALRKLLPPGTRVVLRTDPALDTVDRYGRLLRYVLRGSLNVNVELVRRGAAAPYFYRGARGLYASLLQRLALRARAGGVGLWGKCPRAGVDFYRGIDTGQELAAR